MQIKCIYRKLLHFKIVKLVTRLTVQNIIFFSQGRRVRDKTDVKEACPQCQSQQRRHGFVLPSAYSIFDHIRTAHIYSDIRLIITTPSDLWRAGQVLYNSIHVQLNILYRFTRKALTQWSRACRKSNSSSVQSSAVFGRELTRASHASSLCRVCTQCSVPSHVCLTVSNGSWSHRDTVSLAPGVI